MSDSDRSSHRLDLQWSAPVVSTESFFDFPVPLIILRFAAERIPDMISLAVLTSRFGFKPVEDKKRKLGSKTEWEESKKNFFVYVFKRECVGGYM